ncbi:MAG: extracellular solute-binding protein [Clostridia bacterium]|nr:extracellular solute-binding protein [Clostridia bacterium]
MNKVKRIVTTVITAAVALTTMSAFAACGTSEDYSQDFADLKSQINELGDKIDDLEGKISSSDSGSSGTSEATASDVTINYSGLSGELNVYMPSPAGIQKKFKEEFEALTGVTVNITSGTTGEILTMLEAEGDNHWADVVILASWSDGLSLKADNVLMSYESPYAEYMHDGCVDDSYMLYGTSASAVGVIYNTKYYTASQLESLDWDDYADSQFKGEIAIPDPQKSGACKDFVAGFVTAIDTDYSIIDSWAANGLVNGGGNSPALAAVESGSTPILLAGVDYNAYSAIADGESIAIYYPESGTVINPRPAMIMKTAPHAENAKRFIDYLMSDSAQQIVADAYLIPGRADVDCNSARLGYDEIKQYTVNWNAMMSVSDTAAAYVVEKTAGNK